MPKVNLGVPTERTEAAKDLKERYGSVLTVSQLCEVLQATRRTAEAWAEKNNVRYTVIGNRSKRYPAGEVARALYG